jgi:hypothetical protein
MPIPEPPAALAEREDLGEGERPLETFMIRRRPLSLALALVASLASVSLLAFVAPGCGGAGAVPDDAGLPDDAGVPDDAEAPDAADLDAADAAPDAAPPNPDGTAMHVACTSKLGNALTMVRGRLDGYLVSIVPPGGPHACNGDDNHVHLQVSANGGIYDIAIDIFSTLTPATPYVSILIKDTALPDGPWHEGWNTQGLTMEYVHTFGVHSQQFKETQLAPLAMQIEAELAKANHISVYATGYGPTGAHNVHRSGGGDGAVIINPLSPKARALLFHFASQSF